MKNFNLEQIEEFLNTIIDETDNYAEIVNAIAEKFDLSEEYVEDYLGELINAALTYDEDKYIEAFEKINIEESAIKSSFKRFLDRTSSLLEAECKEDLLSVLKNDKDLKILRNSDGYKRGSLDNKYNTIWKFAIREYGKYCQDEISLSDACEQIANEDENKF